MRLLARRFHAKVMASGGVGQRDHVWLRRALLLTTVLAACSVLIRVITLLLLLGATTQMAVAEDVLVAEFSGSGTQKTRPFTVKGPWEVQWSSENTGGAYCELPTGAALCEWLSITLKKPDEPDGFPNIIANQTSAGPGSSYQTQGGTYYLETGGLARWHIKVVEIR